MIWEIPVGTHDPTFEELLDFVKQDKTDEHPYIYGKYVCADYARDLYNNAERSGIRAGYVVVNPNDTSFPGPHALNVFNTVDKGLVFIDCTEYDMLAHVSIGYYYEIEALYPGSASFFVYSWEGIIKEYKISWW